MIRKINGWSKAFVLVFFRTLLGMIAFAIIQALLRKALQPISDPVFDWAGAKGTIPRWIAVLGIFALQFWLSYKILVLIINFFFDNDENSYLANRR
ncbi:MAG: hypothetical protein QE269_04390 [Fimbriimonas sp.]|nr:hypothetical protein [Fimbriimonas sp.]